MKEVLGSSVAGLPARPSAGLQGSTPLDRTIDQILLADYDRLRNADGLDILASLRAAGWMVAAHNDYRLRGDLHTFWLLTHPDGRYVKGEDVNDGDALAQCMQAALSSEEQRSSPSEASASALSTDEPNTSPQKDITHDH